MTTKNLLDIVNTKLAGDNSNINVDIFFIVVNSCILRIATEIRVKGYVVGHSYVGEILRKDNGFVIRRPATIVSVDDVIDIDDSLFLCLANFVCAEFSTTNKAFYLNEAKELMYVYNSAFATEFKQTFKDKI